MNTADLNAKLIEGYVGLLSNLSTDNKLDLIARLTKSLKNDIDNDKSKFFKAYGAWSSDISADELIRSIRKSRTFKREIEQF